MTIRCLDIPDETAELAQWLEQQLAGDDLGSLVAELRAGHPADEQDSATLEGLLGNSLDSILSRGLEGLLETQLRNLIRHPELLLALQEQILIDGRNYWRAKATSPRITEIVRRQREPLAARFTAQFSTPVTLSPSSTKRSGARWWALSVATLLLLGLGIQLLAPRGAAQIAWNKPGTFQPAGRVEYLNRLATLAGEWFDHKPADAPELASRILEFRRGCSLLILHADSLPAQDREWLLERCRVWSKKLDDELISLESGQPMEAVQQTTDETIRTLIEKLKERAQQAA